jgi:hypothetical protein
MLVPQLQAWNTPANMLVWCKFCKRYHRHGTNGLGHRIAHCWVEESTYHATGYELVGGEPAPKEIVQDAARERPRGPGKLKAS